MTAAILHLLIRLYALAAVVLISFGWIIPGALLYASSVCLIAVYWAARTI